MREALRLGVSSYAFGSDLKDAGIESPTAEVAGYVVKGAMDAYRTETWLRGKRMSKGQPLTKITILAGPPYFITAGAGIQKAIAELQH